MMDSWTLPNSTSNTIDGLSRSSESLCLESLGVVADSSVTVT